MIPRFRTPLGTVLIFLVPVGFPASAQTPDATSSPLREIHAVGEKLLTEAQVVAITGLTPGVQIGKNDLQSAADKLVQSGLFAKVSYNYQTKVAGVFVTYHVEESPRIPVYFDNLPWFTDSALGDAIRAKCPFFDGRLPEAGAAVDQAVDAVKELLASRGVQGSVEHIVVANPTGEGNVQEIRIEGAALQIGKLEFSDPALTASKAVQQHLSEILGKPYSRMTIDLFLAEAIKPIYQQKGFLSAKLGTQKSLLLIDGFYRFGKKEIDGHSRIGLSENLGEMLLHGFGRRKCWIAEFQLCNLQCGAFDADFLYVTFTSRICDDNVLHRALHAAGRQQLLHGVDSLIHGGPGFRQPPVEERTFSADGIAQRGIREPWEIIEIYRDSRRFFDMISHENPGDLCLVVVTYLGKEAALDKLVGGGLQIILADLDARGQAGYGDDLSFGEEFFSYRVDFAQRRGGGVRCLRRGREANRHK